MNVEGIKYAILPLEDVPVGGLFMSDGYVYIKTAIKEQDLIMIVSNNGDVFSVPKDLSILYYPDAKIIL